MEEEKGRIREKKENKSHSQPGKRENTGWGRGKKEIRLEALRYRATPVAQVA